MISDEDRTRWRAVAPGVVMMLCEAGYPCDLDGDVIRLRSDSELAPVAVARKALELAGVVDLLDTGALKTKRPPRQALKDPK